MRRCLIYMSKISVIFENITIFSNRDLNYNSNIPCRKYFVCTQNRQSHTYPYIIKNWNKHTLNFHQIPNSNIHIPDFLAVCNMHHTNKHSTCIKQFEKNVKGKTEMMRWWNGCCTDWLANSKHLHLQCSAAVNIAKLRSHSISTQQ